MEDLWGKKEILEGDWGSSEEAKNTPLGSTTKDIVKRSAVKRTSLGLR